MSGLRREGAEARTGLSIGRGTRVLLAVLAMGVATACDDDTNAPAQDEITVALQPATITLAPGGAAATIVKVTTQVTDPLHMAAVGAPEGMVVRFTPEDLAGTLSTRIEVTASELVAPGHYDLKVTAACDHASSHDVHFSVVVLDPADAAFSLGGGPTEVTIRRDSTVRTTIQVGRHAPFAGAVTLAVTGLPENVDVGFEPSAVVSGNSVVLEFEAEEEVEEGEYDVVVTGSAPGMPDAVLHLTVAVPAPGFKLAAEPASVTLVQGGEGQLVTIAITREAGNTDGVDFVIGMMPLGLTLTQVPPSTVTGDVATMTLKAAADMPLGTQSMTVTGWSADGKRSATAKVTLKVVPPPTI